MLLIISIYLFLSSASVIDCTTDTDCELKNPNLSEAYRSK